jgi:origin recognition complex subunit 1
LAGLSRITFPGYTFDQLMKIIQSRLEGVPGSLVEPDAIQFASRKVAAVSGDARRALDICRRAVEIAEFEDKTLTPPTPSKYRKENSGDWLATDNRRGKVTIATIKQAINEATTSPLQQYLRYLPLSSKLFLAALMARMRRTGLGESLLSDVLEEAKRMGKLADGIQITQHLLSERVSVWRGGKNDASTQTSIAARVRGMAGAAAELMEAGVISLEARKGERTGKVRLNVGEDEIKLALKNDIEVRGLGLSSS